MFWVGKKKPMVYRNDMDPKEKKLISRKIHHIYYTNQFAEDAGIIWKLLRYIERDEILSEEEIKLVNFLMKFKWSLKLW